MLMDRYETEGFFDEMLERPGVPRLGMQRIFDKLAQFEQSDILRRQREAEQALQELGITFTLKSDDGDTERIFPFDLIPRIIPAKEWSWIERGRHGRMVVIRRPGGLRRSAGHHHDDGGRQSDRACLHGSS